MLCQRWPGKTENSCRLFFIKTTIFKQKTHFYSFANTTGCRDTACAKMVFGQIKDK